MNRIRAIAIVLSMVLFLLGAAGNTEDKTKSMEASYEGISQEGTGTPHARAFGAVENAVDIEDIHSGEAVHAEANKATEFTDELRNAESVTADPEADIKMDVTVGEAPQRIISVTEEDYAALLKLVEAEASGEDLKGKMLVANVVVNRLHDGAFGSTIEEVIYQRVNGKAQFSPVANGRIDKVVISAETIEAVERVLCGEDESQGALYFVARAYADADNMAWFDRNLTWLFAHDGHEFFA